MEFSGKLLKRGFWLYIWDIREDRSRHIYVGRTGDSSSPNASSPFRRIGQHLDSSLNAKGNALGRQLEAASIDPQACTFEMIAIGPIFEEQNDMPEHIPLRDKTAALERALADELTSRGYAVLGKHPAPKNPDPVLFEQVISRIETSFPPQNGKKGSPRFQPIKLRGEGPTASERVVRDRDRIVPESRFHPVPIQGEPLSETVIRDRGER